MAFDFAALKAQCRRTVHDTLSVEVVFEDPRVLPAPTSLQVRWHESLKMHGNLVDAGYPDIMETVNRLIFDRDELAQKSISLDRGARVTMPATMGGVVLILDAEEPSSGPIECVWRVVQK